MSDAPVRIAMWSGPRNISTAMMRSWGSRLDCAVSDEPLYAHYLSTLDEAKRSTHPVADQVMGSQPTDWREVATALTGPIPDGKPIWYQKHMAHHVTGSMDLEWTSGLTNCFLIRDPRAMIASFIKVIDSPTPEDLGLPQQVAIFESVRKRTGRVPAVIDSCTVLTDPRAALTALCERTRVPFDDSMLSWEPGPKPEDGVWAPHWYASVYRSTGFELYTPTTPEIPDRLLPVLEECQRLFDILAPHALTID